MRLFLHRALRFLVLPLLFALLATAHASPLSPKDRASVFEQVWELIRDRYYDPSYHGLNWDGIHERYRLRVQKATTDDELYVLLKQMTGELRDAHTRFRTPAERQRASRKVATTTGVLNGDVDGKPVVVDVEPDSEAVRSGIDPGTTLATVDGQPVAERLAEIREKVGTSSSDRAASLLSYYRLLEGEPGSLVRVGLVRGDGSPLE